MAFYCQTKDPTSLITLVIVYTVMVLGNLIFLFTVGYPTFTQQEPVRAGCVIELIVFEFFWLLMLWSHFATMCRQPGFIPLNYRYDREKLPLDFRSLLELPQE